MNDLFLYLAIAVLMLYTIYFLNVYSCRKFVQYENFATTEQISMYKPPNPNLVLIQSQNDVNNKMVNQVFKLSVQIQNMPTYVKGVTDAPNSTNTFYLSVESLTPNCSIQNGSTCLNVYIDNKDCQNKVLSTYVQSNPNRLVLLSDTYINNSSTYGIGKNSDFTIISINNKLFLQNVQTGYYLCLYKSSARGETVYGNMNVDSSSNINSIRDMYNSLCNTKQEIPPETITTTEAEKPATKFVTCSLHVDSSFYLLLTQSIALASPISINSQINGTITIDVLQFNMYGNVKQAYHLSSCAFNVKTGKFIEQITNSLGTFYVNLVCIGTTSLQFNVIASTTSSEATPENTLPTPENTLPTPENPTTTPLTMPTSSVTTSANSATTSTNLTTISATPTMTSSNLTTISTTTPTTAP